MAKTCSRCGTKYSSFFSRCPQCSYEEGTPLSEEQKTMYTKKTAQEQENSQENAKVPISNWYIFAKVLIVIESIAVAILLFITLLKKIELMEFAIILGAYLFELCFLGILQLLAGIKYGIDKLQKK